MIKTVSLVIFNESVPVKWRLGKIFSIQYSVESLAGIRAEVLNEKSDYILFWDAQNRLPTEDELFKTYSSKGNMWHVGSKIGLKSKPVLLDTIQPTNMLHVSIENSKDHSSWKNTFKGCLLESFIFETIEISNYSKSLDIVGLDFGYKAMQSGVLIRYSTALSNAIVNYKIEINLIEELVFIRNNFDTKAYIWCYMMHCFKLSPFIFLKNLSIKKNKSTIFQQNLRENSLDDKDLSTSIVIVSLERYTVLEKELEELRHLQTSPQEIIIIDQTPKDKRNIKFLNKFKDLPIIYLETDKIGQCSARNLGIKIAKSKFIWFLDDDMEEIPKNYLEKHLKTMYSLNADISCGTPDEVGTNYVDRSIPKITLSDGFPTNDVLVKTALLVKVGGFDEKMDQLQSEDQEIGLRIVKEGALSVKNNQLRIVHLRMGRGGLRNYSVRKVTFASSRNSLYQRRLLHYSEIYLNLKHFSKKKVTYALLLNIRGTFIIRGSFINKLAKIFIAVLLLPDTIFKMKVRTKIAKKLQS
jgi:GT2 family glycosyltransferase